MVVFPKYGTLARLVIIYEMILSLFILKHIRRESV